MIIAIKIGISNLDLSCLGISRNEEVVGILLPMNLPYYTGICMFLIYAYMHVCMYLPQDIHQSVHPSDSLTKRQDITEETLVMTENFLVHKTRAHK